MDKQTELLARWIKTHSSVYITAPLIAEQIQQKAPYLIELFQDYDDFYRHMMNAGAFVYRGVPLLPYDESEAQTTAHTAIIEKMERKKAQKAHLEAEIERLSSFLIKTA